MAFDRCPLQDDQIDHRTAVVVGSWDYVVQAPYGPRPDAACVIVQRGMFL